MSVGVPLVTHCLQRTTSRVQLLRRREWTREKRTVRMWLLLVVLRHDEEHTLDQFILWPDISGATQKHKQINSQLHSKYEEMKSVMYTEYSDLNKECFINILAKVIMDLATPEKLGKAGKRVGITSKGLCRVDGPGHV